MKAACKGASRPSLARPSTVVMASPSCMIARVRQALIRRPSTSTVQAPHWPWSQPFLVPVRPRVSRRASSKVTRGSRPSSWRLPLTTRTTVTGSANGAGTGAAVGTGVGVNTGATARGRLAAETVVAAHCRKSLRDMSGDPPPGALRSCSPALTGWARWLIFCSTFQPRQGRLGPSGNHAGTELPGQPRGWPPPCILNERSRNAEQRLWVIRIQVIPSAGSSVREENIM